MRTVITESNMGEISGDPICGEYVGDDYTVYVIEYHDDGSATAAAYSIGVVVELSDSDDIGERYFWDEQTHIYGVDVEGNPIDSEEYYEYGDGSFLFYDNEDAARADAMRHIKAMEDNHEQWLQLDKPVTV